MKVRKNGPPYVRWGLWIYGEHFDITIGVHLNGKPYFSYGWFP